MVFLVAAIIGLIIVAVLFARGVFNQELTEYNRREQIRAEMRQARSQIRDLHRDAERKLYDAGQADVIDVESEEP